MLSRIAQAMWHLEYLQACIPPLLACGVLGAGLFTWWKADLGSAQFALPSDKEPSKFSIDEVRPIVDHITARLAWFVAAFVFFVSSLTGIGLAIEVMLRMRTDLFGRLLIVGPTSVVAIAIIRFWLKRSEQYSGPSFLGRLLRETVEKVIPHKLIGFFNGLAFAGIAFIAGGSSSVILSTGRTASDVIYQLDSLRLLIYGGAALLVASVIEINQLHRWSAVIVPQDIGREIHRVSTVLAGTIGTFFSMLLAAAYVPAFLIIQDRAAVVGVTSDAISLKNLLSVGAVLSPLITGLSSTILSSMFSPSAK